MNNIVKLYNISIIHLHHLFIMSSSSAAHIIPRLTYQLGRSLYIPLTSRCNSIPLPITRGPGFLLGSDVVDVLKNVRLVENSSGGWNPGAGVFEEEVDENDVIRKVGLPEYDLPLVTSLYDYDEITSPKYTATAMNNDDNEKEDDEMNTKFREDLIQPSIASLLDQLSSHLEEDMDLHEVCIAGEGEPMLRMDALLAVAKTVQSFNHQERQKRISVRVITNGLCYSIPHLGYSNRSNPNNILLPKLRYTILKDLMEAGVTRISVALNTSNRHEYDVLMQPACYTGGGLIMTDEMEDGNDNSGSTSATTSPSSFEPLMPGTAHDLVCEFIMDATKLGMEVEITGVDRPGIDKAEMERLARLLLSVAPKHKKGRGGRRSAVRWRPYFQ